MVNTILPFPINLYMDGTHNSYFMPIHHTDRPMFCSAARRFQVAGICVDLLHVHIWLHHSTWSVDNCMYKIMDGYSFPCLLIFIYSLFAFVLIFTSFSMDFSWKLANHNNRSEARDSCGLHTCCCWKYASTLSRNILFIVSNNLWFSQTTVDGWIMRSLISH